MAPGVTFSRVEGDLKVLSARINAQDSAAGASGPGGGGGRRQMIGIAVGGGAPGAPNGGQRSALLDNTFQATTLHDVAVGDCRGSPFSFSSAPWGWCW